MKERHEFLLNDPFLNRIGNLTLATGVAENPDIDILEATIDDYLDRKLFWDAIYLWINIGDRAAIETTSFRERYGLTSASYARRLSELFSRAGNGLRASLVDSMIAMIRKPSGLYL